MSESSTKPSTRDESTMPVRDSASRVIGLTDADHRVLQQWFDELERPCSAAREASLVFNICNALGGYMGIEPEILFPAFLATVRKERLIRSGGRR